MEMEEEMSDSDIVIVDRPQKSTQEGDAQDIFDRLEKKEKNFISKFTAHQRPRTSLELLEKKCCEFGCNYRISRFDILVVRAHLVDTCTPKPNSSDWKNAIYQAVIAHFHIQNGNVVCEASVNGTPVCLPMLCYTYGCRIAKVNEWAHNLYHGVYGAGEHGRKGMSIMTNSKLNSLAQVISSLDGLVQDSPTGGCFLPAGFRKTDLADLGQGNLRYRDLKNAIAQTIKFRKADTHLRCNKCVGLSRGISDMSWSEEDRTTASRMREKHYKEIRKDRLVLKVAEMISSAQPHNLLVMKVDAMGREGTKLPHYIRRPKSVPDTSLFFYDIVDVQLAREQNGLRYLNEVYGNLAELNSRGSDAICSYIFHAVSNLSIIPKMLVINLDNCLTNKSNTFFAFVGWLLLVIKELQQVFLWYCEVGHTHNSVDAFFGTITEKLKTKDVLTPEDLESCVRGIGNTSFWRLPTIYAFDAFLKDATVAYQHRKDQHSFRFFRHENGVSFEYSKYIRCEQMIRGNEGSPSDVFSLFCLESLDRIRNNTPEIVVPLREQVIEKLECAVAVNRGFFNEEVLSAYSRIFEEIRTWAPESAEAVLHRIKENVHSPYSMDSSDSDEEEVINFLIKKNMPVGRAYQPVPRKRPRRQK